MGHKRDLKVNPVLGWVRRVPMKVRIFVGAALMVASVIALKLTVKNLRNFYVASEFFHAVGIVVLIYKLTTQKSCSGLSLKTQELTALFLTARFLSSIAVEQNIHTVLDFLTLAATAWVIYMMRFKLKSTYIKDLDNLPMYIYVVVPSAILSVLVHPQIKLHWGIVSNLFAFSAYVEALSVLPQLHLMQNAKAIEPFTGHYVFALGVARFLAWAHWIIETYETRGVYFYMIGSGHIWFLAALVAELVQSFILVDFCYYYIKSFVRGELLMRMPV